jgi:hypothetical protein
LAFRVRLVSKFQFEFRFNTPAIAVDVV